MTRSHMIFVNKLFPITNWIKTVRDTMRGEFK